MEIDRLREGNSEGYLISAIRASDESAILLGRKLFNLDGGTASDTASILLKQAASASAHEVAYLANAVAPPLGVAIARAWKLLESYPIALPGWTIGEPPIAESRSIWLRDLLRELARFELPSNHDDALRWLAIYGGALGEGKNGKSIALLSRLLGGEYFGFGLTGSDQIGRLLACEIAMGSPVSNDILDTLRLVGTCRHPALSENKLQTPSPHVARALAGCGRDEAIEILCDTIAVARNTMDLMVSAAAQATAAAAEVLPVFPHILPTVLETIAGELEKGSLDHEQLAKQLSTVLSLPASLLEDPSVETILRSCAFALSDGDQRQKMIAGDDYSKVFVALWAESAIDIIGCGQQLLERYEQANATGCEDTKLILRTFARVRDSQTLAMRPLWLRIFAEALGGSVDQQNDELLAEVLGFEAASGLAIRKDLTVPADEALEMLVEVENRLRIPTCRSKFIKVSQLSSAGELENTLVKLLAANFVGRSPDPLLRFVSRLDYNQFALIADVDFSKSDAKIRASVVEKAGSKSANNPKIMIRAIAAEESLDELVNWAQSRFGIQKFDPLFAFACAVRPDRRDFWRRLLLDRKKQVRELGLHLVISALKVVDRAQSFDEAKIFANLPSDLAVDADAIRLDASNVLVDYDVAQNKKKAGDDLRHSPLFQTAQKLAMTKEEADEAGAERHLALARLCERVAQITGIDRNRFTPTPPRSPRDLGSRYADIFGDVAPKMIEAASRMLSEFESRALEPDQQKLLFNEWLAARGEDFREKDGSEILRARGWFVGTGYWHYFERRVLKQAESMMSPAQLKRLEDLRPPSLNLLNASFLKELFCSVRWDAVYDYQEIQLANLDWYESVLAILPEPIQRLGPLAEHDPKPHPQHEQGIACVYTGACDWLTSRQIEPKHKLKLRERLWPLQWWAASFGGKVVSIDDSAIGVAVSNGQASLSDLVRYLVQPGYLQHAEMLIRAVRDPSRVCAGINRDRDAEIRQVIDAVADVCRRQENFAEQSLPPTLANTWRKMPASRGQNGLEDVLRKYSNVPYQSVGRTDDLQKAFVDRIRESLVETEKSWAVKGEHEDPDDRIDFDKVDAWRKKTTHELSGLFEERVLSEDLLLRIGFGQPMLLRSVLEAVGRADQLEAAIWIVAHAGSFLGDLAITLDGDTGHAGIRRAGTNAWKMETRLAAHYAPDVVGRDDLSYSLVSDATVRRSWKQAAIDAHSREDLEPILKVLKAVTIPTGRLRVEGLLDAMDGNLNSPVKRQRLEASIKDRPNLALLQLAVMPLPDDREEMVAEISQRLKIFEGLSIAGRKRKSAEARETMRRALDQVRRTLADNAGLDDPAQLEWLSGAAIGKELAEFERLEMGEYLIQLCLRGDGPHVLISKNGKSLKTIPQAFKRSASGKRLTELQNRLKTSIRDTRAVFEQLMVQQRSYSPEELQMVIKHPVVAAVASKLVFVSESKNASPTAAVGLPNGDGDELLGLDGKGTKVLWPVRVAHPLDLDNLGVLSGWQNWLTDQPPQPFQQVERAIARAADLETANEGKSVIRHDGVQLKNEDQAFRVLQAHGWQDNREIRELCRTFQSNFGGEVTATLPEFMWHSNTVGRLDFRDSHWNEMTVNAVPPIVLSEAIRDVDRTVDVVS